MKKILAKVVKLARLKLPEKEWERFADKAEHVVEYIEKLKTVETEGVEPTSHAVQVTNAFREDHVQPFKETKKILGQAPTLFENLFEVPKVIE